MTIAQNFASKFAVAFVAVAMIFSMFASAVSAQESNEDLQKTINDLLAQIAALQAGMDTTTTTTTTTTTCDVPMAPLTVGAQGGGVTALQNILIADGHVIAAGATGYFGAQTKAALAAWQAANGVAPAAGYYGPITMAALQADCTPAGEDDEDEDEDDNGSDDLQGEGSLDVFEIDNASETDIEEGSEDAEVAELTMEATDGDIEISRLDISIAGTTEDPWDIFESFTLWVDGDMVGEVTADDEDEYLDEDTGSLRFTDLELVLMEDEEVEVVIGATVMSSVDNVPDTGVTITVDEIRYFDADGVATDDNDTDEIGDSASFDVVEAGDGEEITFSLGDNNPESTDLVVDEDDTTDGVTILEYTIESDEGDIDLNELVVEVLTVGAETEDVVDDIMLVIDGEEFDAEAVASLATDEGDFALANAAGDGLTEGKSEISSATTSIWYLFDIDGDVTIEDGAEVTVEVVVDLKSQNGNYSVSGDTIQARVTSAVADITDGEGAEDLDASKIDGSASGDVHTLVSEGIVVPVDGVTTETDSTGDNNQTGEFSIEFEVTAVEGDYYIVENAGAAVTTGVQFLVETAAGTSTASGVLASTADEDTPGVFTVRDGETETFTLTVTVDTNTTTQARVTLTEVNWSADTDGDGAEDAYVPTPASDFRTAYQNINAN